VVGRARV